MFKIAVMPGDGTGPEVTAEAVKVFMYQGHGTNPVLAVLEYLDNFTVLQGVRL